MKLSFLVDNKTENSSCLAEWGLSIFIESNGHKVLFDTGASSMFTQNASNMGIDLNTAEAVVISHGHYDHTEGMPAFAKLNREAKIFIHKEGFSKFYGTTADGQIEDYNCGLRWTPEFIDSIEERLVRTEGIVKLNDNMTIVGNIPAYDDFTPSEHFFKLKKSAENADLVTFEEDPMNHEQILIVEERKGLYVFSGCCHKGAIPTLKYVKELYPDKKIAGFIAGMHLYPYSDKMRENIVEEICRMGMDLLIPVHCTGIDAILKFKSILGDKCVTATSGDIYEY